MIVLGLVLILVGWLVGLGILETIGLIAVIVGIILVLLGSTPYAVGGRRHYF
jgi:F0F1-type ATP synthase membrane subunit c/vacuolar-type H+-ATPase subunit K